MTESLTIALSKGRILDDTLPLMAAAGIEPLDDPRKSRKLIFDTNQPGIKLVIILAAVLIAFAAFLHFTGREFPTSTDDQCDTLIAKARAMIPALADAPEIRRWAGVRPRSRTRAPMVGANKGHTSPTC